MNMWKELLVIEFSWSCLFSDSSSKLFSASIVCSIFMIYDSFNKYKKIFCDFNLNFHSSMSITKSCIFSEASIAVFLFSASISVTTVTTGKSHSIFDEICNED